MHQLGCKPGKRLTDDQSHAISCELLNTDAAQFFALIGGRDDESPKKDVRTADEWLNECREMAEQGLAAFIEELCCDPKMEVAAATTANRSYQTKVNRMLADAGDMLAGDPGLANERPDLEATISKAREFRFADLPYFQDVLGALKEFVRRQAQQAQADCVATSISQIVFDAADYVLETGRSALVEGASGFGKTTALKAWCAMHPGRVRYLSLTSMMDATVFFKRLAKVCGVANGTGLSAGKIQARVEDFLQRSKLMLVVDEAQYLWPQGQRISAHPKFVNWINTACYNEGVPFLISATQEFTRRRRVVETQTDWSSEQSRRRIRKVFPLPEMPMPGEDQKPWHEEALARMQSDLLLVAQARLGQLGLGRAAAEFLVGYAISTRGYFQTITDAIEDAQLIVRRAGRSQINARDLQAAVKEWRAPSDAALQRVFVNKASATSRRHRSQPQAENPQVEAPINAPLNRHSSRVQDAFSGVAGRRETQPTTAPALVPG